MPELLENTDIIFLGSCRFEAENSPPSITVASASGLGVRRVESEQGLVIGAFRLFGRTEAETEAIVLDWRDRLCAGKPPDWAEVDGEFAFVFIDKQTKKVQLVRDGAGIQPLVYAWEGSTLVFGSKVVQVLEKLTQRRFSLPACFNYLAYEFIPDPLTLFEGVLMAPRGAIMTLAPGRPTEVVPFRQSLVTIGEEAIADPYDGLRQHIVRAYEKRLGPLNALYLSGGIDSNVGAIVLKRVLDVPNLRGLTFGVAGAEQSEVHIAEAVAKNLNIPHTAVTVDPSAEIDLEALTKRMNYPYFGMLLTTVIGARVRELGLGPVTMFTGQDTRLHTPHLNVVDRLAFGPLCRLSSTRGAVAAIAKAARPLHGAGKMGKGLTRLAQIDALDAYIEAFFFHRHGRARAIPAAPELETAFKGEIKRMMEQSHSTRQVFNGIVDMMWDRQYTDDIAYMRDSTAMMGNICAFPYYDMPLATYSASLSLALAAKKTVGRAGHSSKWRIVDKYILRKAFAAELPHELIYRDKAVCITNHMFLNGTQRRYVDEWFPSPRLQDSAIFEPLNLGPLFERGLKRSGTWTLKEYESVVETQNLITLEMYARMYGVK